MKRREADLEERTARKPWREARELQLIIVASQRTADRNLRTTGPADISH
jgi:hypothetical protein